MVSQPTAQYGQTLGYCLASAMRRVEARAWDGRRSMPSAARAATALLAMLRPSNRRRERTAASIGSSGLRIVSPRPRGGGPCQGRGWQPATRTADCRIVAPGVPGSRRQDGKDERRGVEELWSSPPYPPPDVRVPGPSETGEGHAEVARVADAGPKLRTHAAKSLKLANLA